MKKNSDLNKNINELTRDGASETNKLKKQISEL